MDVRLDLAAVVSTSLEAVLYGFSIFMFGVTIYILRRNTLLLDRPMNYPMVAVSCALLICSTAHIIIDIVRISDGLVLYRDTFQGGPIAFFALPSQSTFVAKNIVYSLQTLIGDGVLIYRGYVVWHSWRVVAFPIVLWITVLGKLRYISWNYGTLIWAIVNFPVTSIMCIYSVATLPASTAGTVFLPSVGQWITAFFASTLATNFIATSILAYKICITNLRAPRGHAGSLLHVVRIIADAGLLYSATLTSALICFARKSNGQYIVLDIITPVIAITFYMVIIRVGIAAISQRSVESHPTKPFGSSSHSRRRSGGRTVTASDSESQALPMSRLQVHITKVCETDDDHAAFETEDDSRSDVDRKGSALSTDRYSP
ncbi:hypothetical protein BV20DRAFT_944170 [Pilatotrama ljubarskyi]|nr:hypothetical protein BV20DRAFT_944170 [Pilatotrama ljubarskyi]